MEIKNNKIPLHDKTGDFLEVIKVCTDSKQYKKSFENALYQDSVNTFIEKLNALGIMPVTARPGIDYFEQYLAPLGTEHYYRQIVVIKSIILFQDFIPDFIDNKDEIILYKKYKDLLINYTSKSIEERKEFIKDCGMERVLAEKMFFIRHCEDQHDYKASINLLRADFAKK